MENGCINEKEGFFIRKINSSVIQHIEKLFPHVVLNNVSLSNLLLQLFTKNKNYADLVIHGMKSTYPCDSHDLFRTLFGKEETLFLIMKNDDVKLLDEFMKTHSIDIRQYITNVYHGRTLLHHAVQNNAVESCKYLVEEYHILYDNVNERAKHVNIVNEFDQTRLYYAVVNDNETIVNILIDADADVNITDESGKTPLCYAVDGVNEATVNILLYRGADVNISKLSVTPLHFAVKNNNETIVNILVDHGADVNMKVKSGKTPLHYAVRNKNEAIVNSLVDHGADVTITISTYDRPLKNTVKKKIRISF